MSELSPVPPAPTAVPMRPIRAAERIEVIDIIRGVAVLGILLVNMAFFNSPQQLRGSGIELWPDPLDRAVSIAIIFFAETKFYTVFSMLFGLGLTIQMERAEARGAPFVRLYARRLSFLLLIGLVHGLLIWWGDILAMYALLGFALIPFRKCKPKTLVIWIVVLLLIPLLLFGGLTALVQLASLIPEAGKIQVEIDRAIDGMREGVEDSLHTYADGSYLEITVRRATDLAFSYSNLPFWGPNIFAVFLIGLTLGRVRFFQDLESRLPFVRRAIGWFLGIGLFGAALYTFGQTGGPMSPTFFVGMVGWAFGAPAMAFFYVSAIILLAHRPNGHRRLAPLGAVGRMALTNYLMHSVICTLLFYSYGFGLYGRVSPSVGLLLTLAIFALQIPFSMWWLSRFRFGPAEWVWRSLTYGKPQPMR